MASGGSSIRARGRLGSAGKGRGNGVGSPRVPFRGLLAAEEQLAAVLSDAGGRWPQGASAPAFRFAPVWTRFTPNFATKVLRGIISKVVDLRTLNNFYEGSMVFFSTVFAQTAAKLWMPLYSGEQELLAVDQVFHPFPPKTRTAI
jgi:hypothetical protein